MTKSKPVRARSSRRDLPLRPPRRATSADPTKAADKDYNDRTPMKRATTGASKRIVECMWMWLACLEDELDIARCLARARAAIENAIELTNPIRNEQDASVRW